MEAIALRMHKAIIKANDLLMLTRDPAHFITSTITNSTTVDNGITYDEYTANITVSGTAPLGGGGHKWLGPPHDCVLLSCMQLFVDWEIQQMRRQHLRGVSRCSIPAVHLQ